MRPSLLAAALALPLLAACAAGPGGPGGLPIVHSQIVETVYSPMELRASGAPFPAEVRGTPPGGATPAEALEGLRLPVFLGGAPLAPAEPGERGPRIVIAFGGAPLNTFCEAGAGGTALAEGAPLVAALGVCRGERMMTRGILEAPRVGGPSDPAYVQTMNDGLRGVLPVNNPNFDRDRGRPFVPGF
jgi:hypothetical protein